MDDISKEINRIGWTKGNSRSMVSAQMRINELILSKNLNKENITKTSTLLKKLQADLIDGYTSTCSVCGDKQSMTTHMNIEHVTMEKSWGYESLYDCSTHSIVLCCECYRKHIMKGSLGEFVKVNHY